MQHSSVFSAASPTSHTALQQQVEDENPLPVAAALASPLSSTHRGLYSLVIGVMEAAVRTVYKVVTGKQQDVEQQGAR